MLQLGVIKDGRGDVVAHRSLLKIVVNPWLVFLSGKLIGSKVVDQDVVGLTVVDLYDEPSLNKDKIGDVGYLWTNIIKHLRGVPDRSMKQNGYWVERRRILW